MRIDSVRITPKRQNRLNKLFKDYKPSAAKIYDAGLDYLEELRTEEVMFANKMLAKRAKREMGLK